MNLGDIEKAGSEVEAYVKERLRQFKTLGKERRVKFSFKPFESLEFEATPFTELMFCLSTANSSAKIGLKIQSTISEQEFKHASKEELERKLKSLGHRFYPQRAEYMVLARERFIDVMDVLSSSYNVKVKRERLVNLIKGFGFKEASHFLRNVGYFDVAIVDRHISNYLFEKGFVERRKTITRKVYLECESALEKICDSMGISQGELDLYIFYMKTGKVLK